MRVLVTSKVGSFENKIPWIKSPKPASSSVSEIDKKFDSVYDYGILIVYTTKSFCMQRGVQTINQGLSYLGKR